MFKTLITLCLINGEIILASLIFGVLVRDWQKRVQLGQLKEEDEIDGQVDSPKPVRSTAIYDTPFPAWSHLNVLCAYIDQSISACFLLHPKRTRKASCDTLRLYRLLRTLHTCLTAACSHRRVNRPFADNVQMSVWGCEGLGLGEKKKAKRWRRERTTRSPDRVGGAYILQKCPEATSFERLPRQKKAILRVLQYPYVNPPQHL
jgi:hypothetical protein